MRGAVATKSAKKAAKKSTKKQPAKKAGKRAAPAKTTKVAKKTPSKKAASHQKPLIEHPAPPGKTRIPSAARVRSATSAPKKAPSPKLAGAKSAATARKASSSAQKKKRVRDYKKEYARRIERLHTQRGFTRPEARGHARVKKGELGVRYLGFVARIIATGTGIASPSKGEAKDAKELIASTDPNLRRRVRKDLLRKFDIEDFAAERKFRGQRIEIDGVKGPRDWHERRALYEAVAKLMEKLFGIEKSETFSLLFSP